MMSLRAIVSPWDSVTSKFMYPSWSLLQTPNSDLDTCLTSRGISNVTCPKQNPQDPPQTFSSASLLHGLKWLRSSRCPSQNPESSSISLSLPAPPCPTVQSTSKTHWCSLKIPLQSTYWLLSPLLPFYSISHHPAIYHCSSLLSGFLPTIHSPSSHYF